jgi:Alpha galactosidase A
VAAAGREAAPQLPLACPWDAPPVPLGCPAALSAWWLPHGLGKAPVPLPGRAPYFTQVAIHSLGVAAAAVTAAARHIAYHEERKPWLWRHREETLSGGCLIAGRRRCGRGVHGGSRWAWRIAAVRATPGSGLQHVVPVRRGATESEVLQQADYLVSSGLAAAGYDTVNLGDGWMASARTSDGSLTWNTTRFPDSIPWLASQVHALGEFRVGHDPQPSRCGPNAHLH